MVDDISFRGGDIDRYLFDINNTISGYFSDEFDRGEFIDKMLSICKSQCVSESDVAWLNNDDKACIWYWLKILTCLPASESRMPVSAFSKMVQQGVIDSHRNNGPNKRVLSYKVFYFDELGLTHIPTPSSHEDRVRVLIEYLDRFSVDYNYKNKMMADLKDEWSVIVNRKDPFKWVDREDEEQCDWVWSYLSSEVVPRFDFNDVFNLNSLLPISSGERYLFSYGLFHNWSAHPSEKDLLIVKMKNAWGQKKFRRKKSAKRSINTYIDPVVGKKLDELVFHYDLSIHRTIEMLIKKEYERLKGKGI
ncbi:hypothetical protein PU634_03825 [Oceanimonas pelagia]|uniref:Uncharacterized protein n=1 Tax=Oceanimonas pelagia TaxID=3028314 RepID=A0AA50Q883_9GAMM|nr:hypothetical protein [Oceanimonas pelagia]WMC11500.1 hypothetical protein PU634_03825 [Oceanimonas pelagia]